MLAQIRVKELRNLRTAWLDSGPTNQPILFFLHGYPDAPETWQFQVRHFEKHFRVICPYSRGTNPSEGTNDTSRYGSDAGVLDNLQILDFIDPTRSQPVIVIGHDLGVVHAWNLAYYLGPRLKGLVMMNGLSLQQMLRRLVVPSQLIRSWYIAVMNLPYIPEFLIATFGEKFKSLAYKMGNLPEELQPNESAPLMPLNQYRAFLKDSIAQLRSRPRKIQCPLLVLWGEGDTFLLSPTMDELDPFAEHTTVRFLNAGHWVFRERPAEVNELVDKFISELELERS